MRDWWRSSGTPETRTPFFAVACVDAHVNAQDDLGDSDTLLWMDTDRLASLGMQEHPCMLFYTVRPGGLSLEDGGAIHVLGVLPHPSVQMCVNRFGYLSMGHLQRTRDLDISFATLGTTSPNTWWRLPLVCPSSDCDMVVNGREVNERLDFILELWNLQNANDGPSRDHLDACLLSQRFLVQ